MIELECKVLKLASIIDRLSRVGKWASMIELECKVPKWASIIYRLPRFGK